MELIHSQHAIEVSSGDRFEFGKNWARFLSILDDDRIAKAEDALQRMLETDRLDGKRFLDVGCGSGVFSLAAVRLGATVHSFDYDPDSTACTHAVKAKYAPNAPWTIEAGSILDKAHLERLGQFDVVYAWGVLHHTGAMWTAFEHVVNLVAEGGVLFIAIYNDQGGVSRRWRLVKRVYNKLPRFIRSLLLLPIFMYFESREAVSHLLRRQNPFYEWVRVTDPRGMHKWYDWIDWIGGYPFEVAKPEEIFDFYRSRGFSLRKLLTQRGGPGCNEYVFLKGGRPATGGIHSSP